MANGFTYGIEFPFRDSLKGNFLRLTETERNQIKSDFIHLLLTRRGSRYYLPEFGTRLYEFIFEPFDNLTFSAIEADIRDAVEKFMPNLIIDNISITPADPEDELNVNNYTETETQLPSIYKVPGKGTSEYTAKIKINYSVGDTAFAQSDFIIINI
jgi:phage baseplate assembly protein W